MNNKDIEKFLTTYDIVKKVKLTIHGHDQTDNGEKLVGYLLKIDNNKRFGFPLETDNGYYLWCNELIHNIDNKVGKGAGIIGPLDLSDPEIIIEFMNEEMQER
ncbi:hypothetical protein [uncultured Clostridium sp.]|uniref:hypothetical protein n=1 Tax=uncultured Clostridium sp. TaxID=59620 RepID=UPI00262101F6|nr:hypothetical protein [uncultured Clostridium sp.]